MKNNNYKWSLEDIIGQGAFATVFRGHQKKTRTPVAVKQLVNDDNAKRDYQAMWAVRGHVNIVQLLDRHIQPDYIYLIMEYCNRGDLDMFLSEGVPSYRVKLDIMRQCAAGLSHIHSRGVAHRDVKPQNILINKLLSGWFEVKIGDFGLATVIKGSISDMYMSSRGGTWGFRAPELFRSNLHYPPMAVDNYALGLVFSGIVSGIPHAGAPGKRQLQAYYDKEQPVDTPALLLCPEFAKNNPMMTALIMEMTSFNPQKRPAMHVVEQRIIKVHLGRDSYSMTSP